MQAIPGQSSPPAGVVTLESHDKPRRRWGAVQTSPPADVAAERDVQPSPLAPPHGSVSGLEPLADVTLVWFRSDLRLSDNEALSAAAARGRVVCLFIWPEGSPAEEPLPGGASQAWIAEGLRTLETSLECHGQRLLTRRGEPSEVILSTARAARASRVTWSREYEPWAVARDHRVHQALARAGIASEDFEGYLLYEPRSISISDGFSSGHWGTLMPFYKACLQRGKPRRPISAPSRLVPAPGLAELAAANDKKLATVAAKQWARKMMKHWDVSEAAASDALAEFVQKRLEHYEAQRSRIDEPKVSKLSAYLKWGQLSPRQLFWATEDRRLPHEKTKTFGRRLYWRDLSYFHYHNFPQMRDRPIRAHYEHQWWSSDKAALEAWQQGRTGFPIVDAGMRELWETGWMQQNVRMFAAQFLTEILRISWVEGAKWFEETLVDADWAINSMMWQNAGLCGIDPWNFTLNPESAGTQDPTGSYVRTWCPELKHIPGKRAHAPWAVNSNGYIPRIVSDVKSARRAANLEVQRVRKANPSMVTSSGYDLVFPLAGRTHVFTRRHDRDAFLGKRDAEHEAGGHSAQGGRTAQSGKGAQGRRTARGSHDAGKQSFQAPLEIFWAESAKQKGAVRPAEGGSERPEKRFTRWRIQGGRGDGVIDLTD